MGVENTDDIRDWETIPWEDDMGDSFYLWSSDSGFGFPHNPHGLPGVYLGNDSDPSECIELGLPEMDRLLARLQKARQWLVSKGHNTETPEGPNTGEDV